MKNKGGGGYLSNVLKISKPHMSGLDIYLSKNHERRKCCTRRLIIRFVSELDIIYELSRIFFFSFLNARIFARTDRNNQTLTAV